jgi:transposase
MLVLGLPSLQVETLLLGDGGVMIRAASEATDVPCPVCGEPAERVHSRYPRTLADLPWARFAGRLQVRGRRFFCASPNGGVRSSAPTSSTSSRGIRRSPRRSGSPRIA